MTLGPSVEGLGLHGGKLARVRLSARSGPSVLVVGGTTVPIEALRIARSHRATTVQAGALSIATVEHLFAACAALGLHEGLAIAIEGDEVPLLDGGARGWCTALSNLAIAASPPRLRVARDGSVEVGESHYTFTCDRRRVSVEIDFDDPRLAREASWDGDPEDFRERIAGARTFAFAHDLEGLARQNLASHVTPDSVVVIAPEAIFSSGPPFAQDEPARHKLLDLMGDLFLYGGPPDAHVHAVRPGHGATHEAVRIARERGILVPSAHSGR